MLEIPLPADARPASEPSMDRRRHPRQAVIKSAAVHPVMDETAFPIGNISHLGVMGRSALPLNLRQRVHFTFNGHQFLTAEVRWANGDEYGLLLDDPLFCMPGTEPAPMNERDGEQPRSQRIPVNLQATLLITAPVLPARVRNISPGGMLLEQTGRLREGERLLVKLRKLPAFLGRVQWAQNDLAGFCFTHDIDSDTLQSTRCG